MIEVIILDKELYSPEDIAPKTLGSAGLDLKLTRDAKNALQIATEGGEWPYHDLIPTGIKVRVPTNMVGIIAPRSSSGHKHGFKLGNTLGIIDSDYRGELHISIGGGDYAKLKRGATVAQLILVPYSSFYGAQVVDRFSDETERGDGGFGSTDKAFNDAVATGTGALVIGHVPVDNLLVADSCPGNGCADQGCPNHYAGSDDPLPEQHLNVLQEVDHAHAMDLAQEREALAKKNGGF